MRDPFLSGAEVPLVTKRFFGFWGDSPGCPGYPEPIPNPNRWEVFLSLVQKDMKINVATEAELTSGKLLKSNNCEAKPNHGEIDNLKNDYWIALSCNPEPSPQLIARAISYLAR